MHFLIRVLAIALIIFTTWRFASRRQSLPCPVWLRWLVELDNPFLRNLQVSEKKRFLEMR